MNRRLQLALIVLVVTTITSVASHTAIRLLKIRSSYGGLHHYGPKNQEAHTILHSSSLGYSGLDWDRVSERIGGPIDSWATGGSSPTEWEFMHRRQPNTTRTFIVVSPYDLNENNLCDMRADIVPLSQAVSDLRQTHADWPFAKKVLSQYPVMVVRKLFPTVGRSDGVMTGIRDALGEINQGQHTATSSEGISIGEAGMSDVKERLTDWSPARFQRRLVTMCRAHAFDGPKRMALARLVQRAKAQGPVTFAVVPVSPTYQREFLTSEVRTDFESALAQLHQLCPSAQLVRLDRIPALQDDALFSDFVHLNMYGQQIATPAFLQQLETSKP